MTTIMRYCYIVIFILFFKMVESFMIPSEDLLIKMHEQGMFNRINFISQEDTDRKDLR